MIRFFVPGVPAPGGSKRAVYNRATGKVWVKDDCERNPAWRDRVASFAIEAMVGRKPMEGPLRVSFYFTMPRPKSHYGTGRNRAELKRSAPIYHTSKPDTTKLIRAAEDAMTGIVWRDDATVAEQWAQKAYAPSLPGNCNPGVLIEVRELDP